MFWSILFAASALAAQSPPLVCMDARQFIWRAEGQTLGCFDGYAWQTFTVADGLPAIDITGLYADTQGRIWPFGPGMPGLFHINKQHRVQHSQNDTGMRDFHITEAWEKGDTVFFRDHPSGVALYLHPHTQALQRFYGSDIRLSYPVVGAGSSPTGWWLDELTGRPRASPTHVPQSLAQEPLEGACLLPSSKSLMYTPPPARLLTATLQGDMLGETALDGRHLPEMGASAVAVSCLQFVGGYALVGTGQGFVYLPAEELGKPRVVLRPSGYHITRRQAQRLPDNANYARIGQVRQIVPNGAGALIATENGLFHFSTAAKTLQRRSEGYDDVGAMAADSAWTNGHILALGTGKRLEAPRRITGLAASGDGWFGTLEGRGLFHATGQGLAVIPELEGYAFRQVLAADEYLADGKHARAWALAEGQLVALFAGEDGRWHTRRFDVPPDARHFLVADGYAHFFGAKGWQRISLADLRVPPTPPTLLLEGIRIGGVEHPVQPRYDNLETRQRTVIARYLAVSPFSRGDIVYRYALVHLPQWLGARRQEAPPLWHTTTHRELTLPLEAGRYQLLIEAVNRYGLQSEAPLSMEFDVAPPVWQRGWFLAAAVLVIFAGFFAIFKGRERQLKRKNERLRLRRNLAELELQALQAQMNTHFVANALTAIQGFVMRNDKLRANQYIVDFHTLVRLVLDASRQDAHTLDKELELLGRYVKLQQLFCQFDYRVDIGEDIYPAEMEVPTSLFQPLVENAIIHGLKHLTERHGLLCLRFSRTRQAITCVIEDNGVGRARSREINAQGRAFRKFASSVSTKIIKRRFHTLNQPGEQRASISYEDLLEADGTALGTRVTITYILDAVGDDEMGDRA